MTIKAAGNALKRRAPFVSQRFGVLHHFQDVDALFQSLVDPAHLQGHAHHLGHGLDEIDVIQGKFPGLGRINAQASHQLLSDDDGCGENRGDTLLNGSVRILDPRIVADIENGHRLPVLKG